MKHEKDLLEKEKIGEEFAVRLAKKINSGFGDILKAPAEVKSDGILLKFKDGSQLELRYPNRKEYSFSYEKNEKIFILDTAPIHNGLKTFPNHIHDFEGNLKNDDITSIENEPINNIGSFLRFFGYIK